MKPVYLDHNATEFMLDSVGQAMASAGESEQGNPSAAYARGRQARQVVEASRSEICDQIALRPSELTFTSGGTESNVAAVHHVILSARQAGTELPLLLIGATEHSSILGAAAQYEAAGLCRTQSLQVTGDGTPDLDQLASELDGAQGLFLMAANNETGVLADLAAISALVERHRVHWHCDMVQVLGKMAVDLASVSGIGTAAFSAHKLGGPKGTGALFVRQGVEFFPLLAGSMQEAGRRAGTENIGGCVGFAAAAREIPGRVRARPRLVELREHLVAGLREGFPGGVIHGASAPNVGNTVSVSVRGKSGDWADGEELVVDLAHSGYEVATGAACSTGSGRASHVLLAMGASSAQAHGSLRVSLGLKTTHADVEGFLEALAIALKAF